MGDWGVNTISLTIFSFRTGVRHNGLNFANYTRERCLWRKYLTMEEI